MAVGTSGDLRLHRGGECSLERPRYPPGPPLGPTVALYLLGLSPERTRAPRIVVGVAVATLFVVHVSAVGLAEDEFPTVPLLFGALVWGGAWVLGDRFRLRRSRVAELEEKARRAERDAERERRLAVAEERTRIARDLHDSAAHAINVILVQAGAARLLTDQDPNDHEPLSRRSKRSHARHSARSTNSCAPCGNTGKPHWTGSSPPRSRRSYDARRAPSVRRSNGERP